MFGYSIYLSTPIEQTISTIKKMSPLNPTHVFTSFHIPEEDISESLITTFFEVVSEFNLPLVVDVSKATLTTLSLSSIYDLLKFPIKSLRLDYGFDVDEIINLSHHFEIILNASTVTKNQLVELREKGLDFNQLYVLHNFYPRPETGLSILSLKQKNQMFQSENVKTMAFIPGDDVLRQPLFEGLPTVEKHRYKQPLLTYLDLKLNGLVDVVLLGDISLSDTSLYKLDCYITQGIICLNILNLQDINFNFPLDSVFHNRKDTSEYVIRAAESRMLFNPSTPITPSNTLERPVGTLTIDNHLYGRYEGELQITLLHLPPDKKVNVLGYVTPDDLELLSFIGPSQKFRLCMH